MKDVIRVLDAGVAKLRNRLGHLIAGVSWEPDLGKSVVEVKGWVEAYCRERGKIVPGSRREGWNIWANAGRELIPQRLSIMTAPDVTFRNDNIAYIGVGTGSQVEDVNVTSLVTPIAYTAATFMAPLVVPPTFPLSPLKTTVQYSYTFAEDEITTSPGTIAITELGLFTDGNPLAGYAPGTRDTSLAGAPNQPPMAYKALPEAINKTNQLQLIVNWQLRL